MTTARSKAARRCLPFAGGLLAAASVALSAYAAHGVDESERSQLQLAAVFAFGHGIALAALGPRVAGRLDAIALVALLSGVLLFAGSLAASHFLGTPTHLAPAGGLLLIAGWLLHAIASLRN